MVKWHHVQNELSFRFSFWCNLWSTLQNCFKNSTSLRQLHPKLKKQQLTLLILTYLSCFRIINLTQKDWKNNTPKRKEVSSAYACGNSNKPTIVPYNNLQSMQATLLRQLHVQNSLNLEWTSGVPTLHSNTHVLHSGSSDTSASAKTENQLFPCCERLQEIQALDKVHLWKRWSFEVYQ